MPDTFDQHRDKRRFSAQNMTPALLSEIEVALARVIPYGSIEIYVQNNIITQITVRTIKKTSVGLSRV
jgi:hypothetical protein